MAEAFVIVSVVASIVQLVDFSTRVISRLDEFYSVAKEVPKSFRHIKTELPLLATTLTQLKEAIDTTSVADGSTKALVSVIAGCNEQVAQLDAILEKTLPEANDSLRTKGKKAIVSLHYDPKVESITKTLRNYVGILTFYYTAASSTLQPLTDAKLCKIRQWLSAPDPSTNYQKALKLRQADTGLWLLESDAYTGWKMAATTPLWLYGIPGCGKTILSSTLLQDILQYCQDDPGKVTAYFFFDFNDVEKQDPERMVRSLLCQISQQSIKIPASLDALFSSCESGQRQPPLHALTNALQSMIQDLPQAYIVLDALDECTQRVELMEILETMVGWKVPSLHLLVTSRRERDIESCLEGFINHHNRICLQSAVVDKDIQRYVQQRLSHDKRLVKWKKDASMMGKIETALMSGAKGMFRWAVCQLDALAKCVNRKMLQDALATLPPNLDQTYDRILVAIDDDHSQYAFRILQWLTFSARPLSIDEVAEVAAIDGKRYPAFDCDEVLEDPLEVLNICSSLVTIAVDNDYVRSRSSRQVVTLAHYSVKEYLISDRIFKGKAAGYRMQDDVCHDAIATSCLGYLLQFQQPELKPYFLKSFELARYSAEFWTIHAQKAGKRTKETNEAVFRLFCKKEFAFVNWVRLWNPAGCYWGEEDFLKNSEEIPEPLFYAALLGLGNTAKLLLDNGADVNAQGGEVNTALQAASAQGYEVVVRLLLDRGADVDAPGGYHGNALQAASAQGYEAVVWLLLDRGADVNAQGGEFNTALEAASARGHDVVVRLLLDKGADVNAQGGRDYGDALQAASAGGYEAVVRLLLDNGADVNAQGGYYGNPLQAALARRHKAIVRLLLDNGADVNAQGGYYGNPLQATLVEGYEDIVRLLLDKGADVNAQGSKYSYNAIQEVSFRGYETVVRVLLDKGADVNAQADEYYGNALQAASGGGYEAVVRLLLDKGADVNAQGGRDYGDALQAASGGGYEAVVRLLLDKGADVNAQGGRYGNALQVASAEGHEAVVRLLLDRGADVNAQADEYYGTALQAASAKGHEAVVRLLLGKGADVNAQGGRNYGNGNALQVASAKGHEAVVRLLLDKGADVNAQGGRYGNALQVASAEGHEAVVRLLLDRGADVNAQGGYDGNALQAALAKGHKVVVRLLLDKGADINAQGGEHYDNAQSGEHSDSSVESLFHSDS